jgi:phage terminase small subunit
MLTNKQMVFVEEYLRCFNAAEAARRAGYSENSARSIGSENLTKPDIQVEVKARLDELKMSADEVLMRLSEQARATPEIFLTLDKQSKTWKMDLNKTYREGNLHLIKSITFTPTGLKVELYDAQVALVQLAKYHRLFEDRLELHGQIRVDGLEAILEKVYGKPKTPGAKQAPKASTR